LERRPRSSLRPLRFKLNDMFHRAKKEPWSVRSLLAERCADGASGAPAFRSPMASHGSMTDASQAGVSSSIATVCDGERRQMRPPTRCSATAGTDAVLARTAHWSATIRIAPTEDGVVRNVHALPFGAATTSWSLTTVQPGTVFGWNRPR